jgi:hypothetical protein
MLGVFSRILALYARNPCYRDFVKSLRGDAITPGDLQEYFGYGLCVGKKPVGGG